MGRRRLAEEASPLRQGDSGGTVARKCRATGEALVVPSRNRWSKVGRITGKKNGKSVEGERVADGSGVAMKRGKARGAKGPCCSVIPSSTGEVRAR